MRASLDSTIVGGSGERPRTMRDVGFRLLLGSILALLAFASLGLATLMAAKGNWILAAGCFMASAMLVWETVNLKKSLVR